MRMIVLAAACLLMIGCGKKAVAMPEEAEPAAEPIAVVAPVSLEPIAKKEVVAESDGDRFVVEQPAQVAPRPEKIKPEAETVGPRRQKTEPPAKNINEAAYEALVASRRTMSAEEKKRETAELVATAKRVSALFERRRTEGWKDVVSLHGRIDCVKGPFRVNQPVWRVVWTPTGRGYKFPARVKIDVLAKDGTSLEHKEGIWNDDGVINPEPLALVFLQDRGIFSLKISSEADGRTVSWTAVVQE